MKKSVIVLVILILALPILFLYKCAPSELQPIKVGLVPDNEFDPEEWGKVYPLEYESWQKTKSITTFQGFT